MNNAHREPLLECNANQQNENSHSTDIPNRAAGFENTENSCNFPSDNLQKSCAVIPSEKENSVLNIQCSPLPFTTGPRQYRLKEFEIGHLVGSGKYGQVYSAKDRVLNKKVALKLINVDQVEKSSFTQQIRREIEIQGNIHHSSVLKLFGFFIEQNTLYLVLEFAKYGSLYDLLQRDGHLNEQTVAKCFYSLIRAVRHLHRHHVIHRDIKPENVLLGDDGIPRLADFGWSILQPQGRCNSLCGTLDYLAPEMVEGKGYDAGVDIWSLGVLCFELLFGSPPFVADHFIQTSKLIKTADFTFPSTPHVTQCAKDFIQAILVTDPGMRLGLEEMLQHPFLAGIM